MLTMFGDVTLAQGRSAKGSGGWNFSFPEETCILLYIMVYYNSVYSPLFRGEKVSAT